MNTSRIKGIQIRNKADASAEILVYEDIGAGYFTEGLTASGFLKELRQLGNVRNIDIRINSNGGSVFDGLAIYNALRQHPARKTVHVDGIAASIASVIAMAGDEIRMGEGSWMMIHDPSGLTMGTAEQMRETADLLDGIKAQLIGIYALRTGQDEEVIADMMASETWLSATDAIAERFADTLAEPIRIAASADVARFRHVPGEILASMLKDKIGALPDQPAADNPSAPPGPTELQDKGAADAALSISTTRKDITMSVMESLQARASDHQAAAAAIRNKCNAENRDLTDAERTVIQDHLAAFETAQQDIAIQRKLEDAENWLAQPAGRKLQPDGLQNTSLRTQRERNAWGFNNLGDFARTVRNAGTGEMDPRLIANASASTYGTEGVGADGGFAVPPEYKAEIMSMIMGENSLLPRCDATPTASNQVTVTTDETTAWQSSGGVLTYWGSEAGTMTQSKPSLREVTVRLHKLYSFVPVSDELLEDAPALGSFLSRKAAEKIDFAITNAIVNGTGAGQPLGILNSGALVTVSKEGSQAADTIVARNLLKMATRMPSGSFGRAVWLCNNDTLAEIWQANLTFKDAVGSATIAAGTRMPTITLPGENGQTFSTIMGRPVIVTEACDTVGDKGDIILADLKGYFAPYKAGGVRSDVSMHLWFDQGLQAFRWTFRVGGQPWLSTTVSPLNSSNTLSHFVALEAR